MGGKFLSIDDALNRIARWKASELPEQSYTDLLGYNHSYIRSAYRNLRNRGWSDDRTDKEVEKYISGFRSFMDSSPFDRDRFVNLYSSFKDNCKDGVGKFCMYNKLDEHWFRRLTTGYEYYNDIFRNLSDEDKKNTENSRFENDNGYLHFTYTKKTYRDYDLDPVVVPKCFKEESDDINKTIEIERTVDNAIETTIIRTMPDGTEKHSGRYPWGSDDPLPDGTNLDELTPGTYLPNGTTSDVSEDESIDENYDYFQHVIQIRMSRYDGDDLDRMFNVDIPYDTEHMDQIFDHLSILVHSFMTAR